jgi:hypothetical protein
MQVWRVLYRHPQHGDCFSWHRTKAQAKAAFQQTKFGLARDNISRLRIEATTIPLPRDKLIEWLNNNFNRSIL